MTLYPMSYVEFLRACGEENLADFIQSLKKGDAIPEIAEKMGRAARACAPMKALDIIYDEIQAAL